jgi:PncC family amidohydrolase
LSDSQRERISAVTTLCLEAAIGQLLTQRRLTLALAESCTGGLVAHRITNVPGSSAYLIGVVVAYSNDAKARVLGVPTQVLAERGAVSPQAALAMAQGARSLFGTDIGLAVTGVAGPGGGSPDKPIGLVYLHLTTPDGDWDERHLWAGSRHQNKAQSADAALLLLCRWLRASATEERARPKPVSARP